MADDTILNPGAGGDTISSDDISGIKHQQVLLEFGPNGTATRVARAEPLPVDDPFLDIAKGNTDDFIQKFGCNLDLDSGIAEDIWDAGGLWVPPTTARLHDVVSTDINDDGAPAGTGARTLEIFGLDSGFLEINETIVLNGTTIVPTVNAYTMIFRMIVRTAGSGGSNAGIITATAQTDATVTAQVTIGKNQTLMAIYQVPANRTAYAVGMQGSVIGSINGGVTFELLVTPDGETLQTKFVFSANSQGSSDVQHFFVIPLVFTAKSIIRVRGTSDTNNLSASGSFDLVLEAV